MNEQKPERVNKTGRLEAHSVWRTIQGEGPLAGAPAVFVRLTGCNLQCPLCDTEYTAERLNMSPAEIVTAVDVIRQEGDIVVITGGEPLRQQALPDLIRLLLRTSTVQVETNGTYYQDLTGLRQWHNPLHVVCSPKGSINRQFENHITAFKYVVQAGKVSAADGLPDYTLGNIFRVARPAVMRAVPVFVQPLDEHDEEANARNLQEAVNSCMKFGYRLSLQLHKQIGLE